MIYTLLLDNGHGCDTAGKRSPDGRLKEFEFARRVVKRCVELAEQYDLNVVVITPEENDIALSTRAARANDYIKKHPKERCVFVSIHSNAFGDGSHWLGARGWEAWTTVGQNNSDKLAECLYDKAAKFLPAGTNIRTDRTDGDRDKEKDYTIIKKANCPAVLTENFFHDNREDCEYMLSDEGIDAIARLHLAGVRAYFI